MMRKDGENEEKPVFLLHFCLYFVILAAQINVEENGYDESRRD